MNDCPYTFHQYIGGPTVNILFIVSVVIQADHVMCHVIKLGHFDRANFLKLYLVKYKEGA